MTLEVFHAVFRSAAGIGHAFDVVVLETRREQQQRDEDGAPHRESDAIRSTMSQTAIPVMAAVPTPKSTAPEVARASTSESRSKASRWVRAPCLDMRSC